MPKVAPGGIQAGLSRRSYQDPGDVSVRIRPRAATGQHLPERWWAYVRASAVSECVWARALFGTT
jgi:hypothetical protein